MTRGHGSSLRGGDSSGEPGDPIAGELSELISGLASTTIDSKFEVSIDLTLPAGVGGVLRFLGDGGSGGGRPALSPAFSSNPSMFCVYTRKSRPSSSRLLR